MIRKFIIIFVLIFFWTSYAAASIYSKSGYSQDEETIIAAVHIKEKGIYNLAVTVQFLRKPFDEKIYSSDGYKKLIDRLLVESRGIILQRILEQRNLAVTDFADLKKDMEIFIGNLIAQLKKDYVPGQEVEVVFSITDFYLVAPYKR